MAVKLRLQRHGSKGRPFYHIVAADTKAARDGKFIEKIGYYDPNREPSFIEIKEDRMRYWYGKGATLTNTVKNLAKLKNFDLIRDKTVAPKESATTAAPSE